MIYITYPSQSGMHIIDTVLFSMLCVYIRFPGKLHFVYWLSLTLEGNKEGRKEGDI